MIARLIAACAVVLSLMAASPALAQSETPYATFMGRPANLSFNAAGELYAGEFNGSAIFVAPAGGGAGAAFFDQGTQIHYAIIGPDDALYVALFNTGEILRYAPGSTTPDALPYVTGVPAGYIAMVFDSAGRLFAVSRSSPNVYQAPAGGGAATLFAAVGSQSMTIAIDSADNLYTIPENVGVITRVTPGGVSSAFSTGNGAANYSLAVDPAGNVYAADYLTGQIFQTGPGGGAATLYYDSPNPGFTSLTYSGGTLYAGNYDDSTVYTISVAATVPTMSEWAMIVLALGLAGSAAVVIQRRRVAA